MGRGKKNQEPAKPVEYVKMRATPMPVEMFQKCDEVEWRYRDTVSHFHRPQNGNAQRPRARCALTFNIMSWLKLNWALKAQHLEVSLLAVTSEHDPLYVRELHLPKQLCSYGYTEIDDEGLMDYSDACNERGLPIARYLSVWCHTHPGDSPQPSWKDEDTFERLFAPKDYGVMFIIARGGQTYARLRHSKGVPWEQIIPVQVDMAGWYQDAMSVCIDDAIKEWCAEYNKNVFREAVKDLWSGNQGYFQPHQQDDQRRGSRVDISDTFSARGAAFGHDPKPATQIAVHDRLPDATKAGGNEPEGAISAEELDKMYEEVVANYERNEEAKEAELKRIARGESDPTKGAAPVPSEYDDEALWGGYCG